MKRLSDAALAHLRQETERPDLSGTPYEIVAEIGRGGMGTVYRAVDRRLGRQVALKVLPLGGGPARARRLEREARILARLEHPGIVPVHDVLPLPDGRAAYTMKWVQGRRLDEHRTPDLPLAERLRIFERIAEPVAFAHAQGVIHRDLKPQNVMVGPFGEVLVLDWGIARLAADGEAAAPVPGGGQRAAAETTADGAPLTTEGTVIGTPGYMAPEQARGEGAAVDPRTDVFALGALLRFLLEDTADTGGRIPRPLRAVIDKACATLPGDRYPGVAELAADIARFRQGQAVGVYRELPWEAALRLLRRYQLPAVIVLTYLLARALLLWLAPAP
jgi:serine/threonine protein kinase